MSEAREVWEKHYRDRDRVWSGRVNVRLAEIAGELTPARALDLGCGEGGDAMWLAEQGWQVTAVDISQTALDRAAADARQRNVLSRIEFQRVDLAEDFPAGQFDLVSAQFLHSMLPLDRPAVLRRASQAVAPGGLLVIVDHGAAPPGAAKFGHHHHFPGPQEVIDGLALDAGWQRLRIEAAERDGITPDWQTFTWTDNIIVLRRAG